MHRRHFLKSLASAVPAVAVLPSFEKVSAQERGKVKITDVKCMRVKIGNSHVMPLVKIETDSGIYGIGE